MQKRLIVIVSTLMIFGTAMAAQSAQPAKGILYTKPVESVIFSHSDHLQKGTTCATCHSGLFEMEALKAQKNKDFTMDSLYKGKYCGACHDGKKAFASDTQCARCHVGANYPVPQKDTPSYKASVTLGKGDAGITFHHDKHLKKANCLSCHPSLFEPKEGTAKIKMADHSSNKYCFGCHDDKGKGTFSRNDCNRCHTKAMPAPTDAILYGKGEKAVTFRHESHKIKEGCKACHPRTFEFKKGTAKIDFNAHGNGKSCFTCHDQQGKKAFAWNNCALCHKKTVPAPGKPVVFGKESKMGAVTFKHDSHPVSEGCKTCHPKPFAYKAGTAKIGFKDHSSGQSCFSCHAQKNATAFYDCGR